MTDHRSQYKTVRGVMHKTCPRCAKWAPLAGFGERQLAPGNFATQSYCPPCRGGYKKASENK